MKALYQILLWMLLLIDSSAIYFYFESKVIGQGIKTISNADLFSLFIINMIFVSILVLIRKNKGRYGS
ncbi:hypothetical protein HYN59_02585 [Flavobacterium album]|uniref:Uncharacterized protein n=1 Tax=Flavobacterium album TaxID=2175091 RepID=A0A2S1QUK2_9FLAO|nr:hypothetical protein HYN59_02585 [Flavobacterium album]